MYSTPPILNPAIPTEIYLCIADHLHTPSLVALTLTSKRLLSIFGTRHHTALRTELVKLAAFLRLLERDLPEHFYLDYLLRRRIPGSTPMKDALAYPNRPMYSILASGTDYTITYPHLLLALKREIYGEPHGLPLSVFAHSMRTVLVANTNASDEYLVSISIVPKIVSQRLLLRTAYHITPESTSTDTGIWSWKSCAVDLRVSRHTGTSLDRSPWYDNALAKVFHACRYVDDGLFDERNIDDLLGNNRVDTATGTCMFCLMDWEVEKQESGRVVLTTWTDLGSRVEGNEVWKSVVGEREGMEYMSRILPILPSVTREAFESGVGKALVKAEWLMQDG
jgi:hypothetical protein